MRYPIRSFWICVVLLLLIALPGRAQNLVFVEVEKDGVNGVDGLSVPDLTLSPDDKHVYVAGRDDNSVAVFSRDSATGSLTFVEIKQDGVGGVDGLAGARSASVSPDGRHVYVTGEVDNAVAVFSRNPVTGVLTFVEVETQGVGGVDGLTGAQGLVVSPDGAHLYIVSLTSDAVAVFSRDSATGSLTFVEVKQDGVGGVDGLDGGVGIAASADGKHIYATGSLDNSVAVFSRDSATGSLTFVEVKQDGVGGVDGLNGAFSVTVSSDGKHVYAAGSLEDAVAVFSRDSATGVLTFVEIKQDGVGGVDGLNNPKSVAVSPDGRFVLVAGEDDNSVALFSRDSATGVLTFVEIKQDGVGGVDGLGSARSVQVSRDGAHIYASANENAVAAFTLNTAPTVLRNIAIAVDEGATGRVITQAVHLEISDAEQAASALTFTLDSVPANGSLKKSGAVLTAGNTYTQADINAGVMTYDHNGGETTADSFQFDVSDGQGGSLNDQIYSITVTPVNDPPVVAGIGAQSFNEDATLILNMDGFVTDPDHADGDMTWSVTGNSDITVNINTTTRVITLGTKPDFTGAEQLVFSAADPGGLTDSETVTVTALAVNDAPVITSDPITTVAEDAVYIFDTEATDADGDALTFSLLQSPPAMTVDAATGVISWQVPLHQVGDVTVSIRVTDGSLADTLTWTLSVRNVNDAPTITFSDTSFVQKTSLTVPFSALNFDDRDPDDDFASLKGSLRINGLRVFQPGLVGKANSGSGTGDTGADVQGNIYFTVDTTANEVRFSHRPQFFGEEKLSFEVTDQHGARATDEVSVRVTPVPVLTIFPVADTIKTNAAEFVIEGVALNADSLWIDYVRKDSSVVELPLILITNNQFSQLVPINNGTAPQTIRVNMEVKNTFGNTNSFVKHVVFRPTVDVEQGGTISINDGDDNPNNNTRVEVGDEAVLNDVDLVIIKDDATSKILLSQAGVDSSRLVSAFDINAFDLSGNKLENFTFERQVTLVLAYDDTGLSLDEERNLAIYFFDGVEFRLLGGIVDTDLNTVTVKIDHLTQFAVMKKEAADDKGFVYAAPNPFTPVGAGNEFDETAFIIPASDLSVSFTIEIYNIRGQLIHKLENATKWDGRDKNGRPVDAGLYLFQYVSAAKRTSGTVTLVR